MPTAPLWPQALIRYPFATELLPGWRTRADELPEAYSAALDAALAAFDPKRPLSERYQHLCASRAQLVELAAAGDQHFATLLLRLRVWIAFGEPRAAWQFCGQLLEQSEWATQSRPSQGERPSQQQPNDPPHDQAAALRERPFLPSCARFDDCPPLVEDSAQGETGDLDAWLSAMLLETHAHLSAERRREQPQAELPRLAQRRKLPFTSVESERMVALSALRLGKKVTIKPESRLIKKSLNAAFWSELGQPNQNQPFKG